MDRIVQFLVFCLFINFQALASDEEFISTYFKRVPIEEAHVVSGHATDNDFDSSIKVLVWNIKKTQEANWQKEFLSFAHDRDLFLIQEAYPNSLFTSTLDTFEDIRWDMGISFLYKLYDYLPTGTMIGSKVLPTYFVVKHSPDMEPVTETPKAMTYAKFPLEGRREELLVINVHGINFNDFGAFKRHMGQVEEEILKHSGPVLIAGDFNTRTKDRTSYMFHLMKKLGLQEIQFKNGDQRMTAKFTNNILDYGFIRGLRVLNAEVLGFATGSDHKPMRLEISAID